MPFGANDSNIKLRAPDDKNYATEGLQALGRKGVGRTVTGDLPQSTGEAEGHLQGVALRDDYAILTTSARDGFIVLSRRNGNEYSMVHKMQVESIRHPAGMQTIGEYLVVPGYDSLREIRFYRYMEGSIQQEGQLTIPTDINAKCVGITNCSRGASELYILAACNNENEIHFYRSNENEPLSSGNCTFENKREWDINNVSEADREDWQPDKNWRGYPNSISLISDEGGNVYFLGLRKTRLLFGKDIIDLYKLDFDASEEKMLTKMASFHAKCRNGTSFRWGGSALVTSEMTFRIYACRRNVWTKDNTKITKVNVFHADTDPLQESQITE